MTSKIPLNYVDPKSDWERWSDVEIMRKTLELWLIYGDFDKNKLDIYTHYAFIDLWYCVWIGFRFSYCKWYMCSYFTFQFQVSNYYVEIRYLYPWVHL